MHDDCIDLILPIANVLDHSLKFVPPVVRCGGSGFNELGSGGQALPIAPVGRLPPLIWY
jgi:hypothetical protein